MPESKATVAQRYAVQESDTTMMIKEQMPETK